MPSMQPPLRDLSYPEQLAAAWQRHVAPRAKKAPTVISTFAGGGGSSLGYSFAGYRELLAVEFDDHAVATLKANFPHLDVHHGDIAKLSVGQVLERTGLKKGELAVFDGSPPCQGFSLIGKRVFDDSRNQLFREYVRLLKGLQPRGFVLENVAGLTVGKMRLIFAEMLTELKACGYDARAWVLNAKDFGVPQSRRRLVVLGVRKDLDRSRLGPPTFRAGRPRLVQHAVDGVNESDPLFRKLGPVNRRIWKEATFGDRGNDIGRGDSYFSHVKVSPYRPSPTLTKVGGHNYMHWREPRSMSIAEAKRVSSFPDEFQLSGNFDDQWGRLGNSVPPFFMWAIAAHMRDVLEV